VKVKLPTTEEYIPKEIMDMAKRGDVIVLDRRRN
jgi:hypothetical protein